MVKSEIFSDKSCIALVDNLNRILFQINYLVLNDKENDLLVQYCKSVREISEVFYYFIPILRKP